MKNHFSIKTSSVHLWRVDLKKLMPKEPELFTLLSPDEVKRAERYKFDIHKQRYVIARGVLRRVLSLYMDVMPAEIEFIYGLRGKPFLNHPTLQFNVSHSHELAVFSLTRDYEIGVDIEKIEDTFKEAVAKRFFSPEEYRDLSALPEDKKVQGFYRIWSKKEALIKAVGEGLFAPLDTFSVSLGEEMESISFLHDQQMSLFQLKHFFVHADYEAAFATPQTVKHIQHWQWTLQGPSEVVS